MRARVTERTYYPILMETIKGIGGNGVQEVCYNSEPDVIFEIAGHKWILGVKIGEDPTTLRQAFLQYLHHKDESGLKHGILLFLPKEAREVNATYKKLTEYINTSKVFCLLDTPAFREESRSHTFSNYLKELVNEVLPRIDQGEKKSFSLNFAVEMLKEHIQSLMEVVELQEDELLSLITNPLLFSNFAGIKDDQREYVGKFLAAYIILSQIMFLRLLGTARPELLLPNLEPVSKNSLRRAFNKILEVNYRPIFQIDVLNCLNDQYIKETFNIIWGLKIEEMQHELPGRIYNELMPPNLRKMLAAFFTRPLAAELLAKLTIEKSDVTLFDPACGSGTLLQAGYKRKRECFYRENKIGNPHQRFCEEDIYGIDIMPFSVHLTAANLAAIDPKITLNQTKIFLGDSLRLKKKETIPNSLGQLTTLFSEKEKSNTGIKNIEKFKINKFDIILMNPPFTKLERGIQEYVNLENYSDKCGREVGVWGHFVALANKFLKKDGLLGAVLPINVLRGRESSKVRNILFNEMTPLFIIKPVVNYGFSESAEYRDIIIITKCSVKENYKTKFILLRRELKSLDSNNIEQICKLIKEKETLKTPDAPVHITTMNSKEINKNLNNLMPFCGVTSFEHQDILLNFVKCIKGKLMSFPNEYFREGYRPRPKGIAKVLFLTRGFHSSRTTQAFLMFNNDYSSIIKANTRSNVNYHIEKDALFPAFRTATGVETININDKLDYIAIKPYRELSKVVKASGFNTPDLLKTTNFWDRLNSEVDRCKTFTVVNRRINPFSPNNNLVSFMCSKKFLPANTMHPILETNKKRAKAITVLFNSILFWIQFFLLKEESTGRWIDIRHSDLYAIQLYPKKYYIDQLANIYDKFSDLAFSAFINQVDVNFNTHYRLYHNNDIGIDFKNIENTLPFLPSDLRLSYDKAILKALNINFSEVELFKVYEVLAKEMIIIKSLRRN